MENPAAAVGTRRGRLQGANPGGSCLREGGDVVGEELHVLQGPFIPPSHSLGQRQSGAARCFLDDKWVLPERRPLPR